MLVHTGDRKTYSADNPPILIHLNQEDENLRIELRREMRILEVQRSKS